MEIIETEEVKLSAVCRICLRNTEDMSPLFEAISHTNTDLVTRLKSIGNIEIEYDEFLPHYLCHFCNEKLTLAYDFRQMIRRSDEFLRQCIDANVPVEIDLNDLKFKNDNNQVGGDDNNDDRSSDLPASPMPPSESALVAVAKAPADVTISDTDDIIIDSVATTNTTTTRRKTKEPRRMRLLQFPSDQVTHAIQRSQTKFAANMNTRMSCILCGFISRNTSALSAHMTRLHKEMKSRWCAPCNLEVVDLNQHYQLNHNSTNNDVTKCEDMLKCEFCAKICTTKGHFIEHLHGHSDIRPFRCDTCPMGFISARHLRVHMRTHSGEKPYECEYCARRFRQIALLRNHLKVGHRNQCTASDANTILDTNTNVQSLNYCHQCNRKVRSLAAHLKTQHSDGNELKGRVETSQQDQALCNTCGRQFKTNSKLRLHMRVHTGEVPYKCSYCDKRTSTRNQLVVHERIHTGEKPHVCNVCGKAFAQSSVLNTHMRLHTGRPEQCTVCLKRFCRPAELRLHMRKHTGEKPYVCVECGQGFKQRSHLMEHAKTHSDERPYKCEHCEKAFKQSSTLKSHVQIHLGFKPYQCSQCPYACRQSYSLTQHMRQHFLDSPQPNKPYVCVVCDKSFSTIAMLTSHTNAVHAMSCDAVS